MITIFDYKIKGMPVDNWIIWVMVGIPIAIAGALYALRSIGIYKLAKNNGEEKLSFMAWIPCVWIYLACKLVKEGNFFGKPFRKFALLVCIVFSVTQILAFVYEFLVYLPLVSYFLYGGEIYIYTFPGGIASNFVEYEFLPDSGIYVKSSTVIGGLDYTYGGVLNLNAMKTALNVISYVSIVLDLANTVLTVFLFFTLFRNYWPEHYVMASIFSFFGLFAPFAFVIRNKRPVKYQDFLRNRYGQRPYFYYEGQPKHYGEQQPAHPFEEFAEKGEVDPGDPFDEFSDKQNKDE